MTETNIASAKSLILSRKSDNKSRENSKNYERDTNNK